ncbi:MAG: response regulator [bacterium]
MTLGRILLIDDDLALQMMVGDQLRMEGYEVTIAANGDEAILILRQTPPDLIILDISMPGMTGLTLLKKISGPDGKPRYPVLVFTARANMEQFFKTTEVEGFLAKTSNPSNLIAEVKRILLKTKKPGSPAATLHIGKRKAVLILEDEPILNQRLQRSFIAAGYEAIAISDIHLLTATILACQPRVILLKAILNKTTGSALAESLVNFEGARGIPIILFDSSGVYKQGDKFINVDRFVPSNTPADLLKAVAGVIG